jgi:spore germination cell wall hydrolase CwlJ-like protein
LAGFARCRRIARRILAGTVRTPAFDAVAYHRESARPAWASGRTPVAEVGDFVFYASVSSPSA